jgi:hypothetical protein
MKGDWGRALDYKLTQRLNNVQSIFVGTCESDLICFGKATEATRKALSLDANNSDAHALASWIYNEKRA